MCRRSRVRLVQDRIDGLFRRRRRGLASIRCLGRRRLVLLGFAAFRRAFRDRVLAYFRLSTDFYRACWDLAVVFRRFCLAVLEIYMAFKLE